MTSLLLLLLSLPSISLAYRPGDIVPMSKMSQYHNALIPIAKPTGFTGADPVKISFQVGREKFRVPWLFVINRKSSQVPMIDVHLRYSGNDLLGVTAKIVDMPQRYVEIHPDLPKYFWQPESWPKHVLIRYTWEEQSEIDVASGFYVLFASDLKDVKIQATNIPNSDGLLQLFPDFCRRLLQKVACLVMEWQRLNDGTSKHVLLVPDLFMPMVAWKSLDKLLSTWILSI
ncbi:hypothetical protein KPL71_018270 [Citrus sinensis]|uniref:Uncharacterized protein n=1 Tax=Citrus sinensis TaxID=2711 RepID=A0ACB8JWC0_CITSI|nr:hypothetical protein KPL71_018270 [Citrus sinensis]